MLIIKESLLLLVLIHLSEAIKMEIQLMEFDTKGRQYDGQCCDPFCGDCDAKFEICLGTVEGDCCYADITSGIYEGQNIIEFGSWIGDSENPFDIKNIPDSESVIRFQMRVYDDDGSNDDLLDTYDFNITPEGTGWTPVIKLGERPSDKTRFHIRHRITG